MRRDEFESREAAAEAAAGHIVESLETRLAADRRASLIVTGGSSPADCYATLSTVALPWSRIHVIPSDERYVAADDDASNEKLIRDSLLVAEAAEAEFLPMYYGGLSPSAAAERVNESLRRLPIPFAACLLGMGEDGHFASLFPDADNLEAGLDVDSATLCLPVTTEASPHPRVSLTLSAIARSDVIIVLAFGEAKRRVIDAAIAGDVRYPATALLRQKKAPVHFCWAP